MTPSWELAELGAVVRFINGDRGPNYPSRQDRVRRGIPFINAGHLDGGRVALDKMEYITPNRFTLLRSGKVELNDILLCIRGTLGRAALVTEELTPGAIASSLVILRTSDYVEPRFLLPYLLSSVGQQQIASLDNGAAQPNVGAKEVGRIRIPLPPLSIQRKVAAILSTYDDLIDNNSRRLRILEEMAERIYHEWFLAFRYPGRQGGPVTDSALGLIPEGWSVMAAGDVIETLGGGTPSTTRREYWDEATINWYTPSDLTAAKRIFAGPSTTQISASGLSHSAAKLFPAGSVMMTSRATIGVVAIASTVSCTNQGFIVCVPTEALSTYHVFFWIRQAMPEIDAMASGATFKEISRSEFRGLPVIVPSKSVEAAFVQTVQPLFEEIHSLEEATVTLKATRECLLPRLMSGGIDVEHHLLPTGEAAS